MSQVIDGFAGAIAGAIVAVLILIVVSRRRRRIRTHALSTVAFVMFTKDAADTNDDGCGNQSVLLGTSADYIGDLSCDDDVLLSFYKHMNDEESGSDNGDDDDDSDGLLWQYWAGINA